jgi:hypothetical protein
MKQNGAYKGSGSNVFDAAFRFFKEREKKGIKIPTKKQKTSAVAASGGQKAGGASKKPTTSASPGTENITIDGESNDTVSVLGSCDEVRRKINAHLRKDGVTAALFLRDLQAQVHGARKPANGFQSSQLARFRGQKGPVSGNTSAIYYAGYIFFEKERLALKKDKSKHRLNMEKSWGDEGVDTKSNIISGYLVRPGETVRMDEFGQVSFHR